MVWLHDQVSGKVTYNGHEMSEFVPQRTAAYVDQNDLHIAEMTVRETLAFSARVQGVGLRYDLLEELSRREKHANIMPDPDIDVYMKAVATEGQKANLITYYVLRILGLETCADTVVGNAMLRGISGGQKKRVKRWYLTRVLSWRWYLTRVKSNACLFYEWCWDPMACLVR